MRKSLIILLFAVCGLLSVFFLFWIKPSSEVRSDPLTLGGANVTADIRLPILMYHSIVNEPSRWGTYVISSQELESDLKYLQGSGYTAVTMQDLLDYVDKCMPLPPKPVMLTFDDGYYNNYLYAFPLLKKYGMKAVVSIIGRHTDRYTVNRDENPLYSHITWTEAIEMVDSGIVELQNHSYDLHTISGSRTASMKAKGESDEHYETVLLSDSIRLQSLIDNYTHRLPTAYTYPFGLISKESVEILKEAGFRASFSCYAGMNVITSDPQCLYLLRRNLRPHGKSAESILKNLK